MSEAAQYQYGEIVDITIRGAKVVSFGEPGLFVDVPGDERGVRLPVVDGKLVDAVGVKVVQPADGVPMVGDLWVDHTGTRYVAFLQARMRGLDEVMLHNGHSGYRMAELCEHGFRMSLVYREPAPLPEPAAPVFGPSELDGIAANVPTPTVDPATAGLEAAEPPPSTPRRIDYQGDQWRQDPDGRWQVYDGDEPAHIFRNTVDEIERDYGPLTNPDEDAAEVTA